VRGEEGLRERDRKAEAARERAVVIVDGSPRAVDLLTLLRHHCVPLTTLLRGHVTLLRRPLTTLLRVTHFSLTSFIKGHPQGITDRSFETKRDPQTARRQLALRNYSLIDRRATYHHTLRQCYQRATYLLSAHSVSSWGH